VPLGHIPSGEQRTPVLSRRRRRRHSGLSGEGRQLLDPLLDEVGPTGPVGGLEPV
jgi:hypothetical protein